MPKLPRNQKVTNFVKGSIKYPFRKRLSLADKQDLNTPISWSRTRPIPLSLADKQDLNTPTERTIPIFHPSPFSDGKPNFYPSHLIGFHIKQTTPYLCPKPSNGIELSELYRIGKLFLHGDMPPCLVGYEWSYLFTSNGE